MPAYSIPGLCDGCRDRTEAACDAICPADILRVDPGSGKAVNIEPDACWECYACVKACPQQAMQVRGYSDGVPLGARLVPHRGAASILWEVQYRDGSRIEFDFPIRTTAWGTIEPYRGLPPPSDADLRSSALCGQAAGKKRAGA